MLTCTLWLDIQRFTEILLVKNLRGERLLVTNSSGGTVISFVKLQNVRCLRVACLRYKIHVFHMSLFIATAFLLHFE